MPKVRVLELRKTGPCAVRRTVKKGNLKGYRKVRFRGVVVLVRPVTIQRIRDALREPPALPKGDQPPRGRLPDPGVESEDLIVREDYRGGRRRSSGGRSKGRTSGATVKVVVRVRGTQAQRDAAAKRLESMLVRELPFITKSGIVGRRAVPGSGKANIDVKAASFKGRHSGRAARAIMFELLEEIS